MNGESDASVAGLDTARAWSEFRDALASKLRLLDDDEVLHLETHYDDHDGGVAPYMQFVGYADGMLRVEATSNEYLAPSFRLFPQDQTRMVDIGWHAPTCRRGEDEGSGSANYFIDLEQSEASRAAALVVRTLREVIDLEEPAQIYGLNGLGGSSLPGRTPQQARLEYAESLDELAELLELACFSASFDYTRVGQVVVARRGDAQVEVTPVTVFALRLEGPVVAGVQDYDAAVREVNILNRDSVMMRYYLEDDAVSVAVDFLVDPFIEHQVQFIISLVLKKIEAIRDDLAWRVHADR